MRSLLLPMCLEISKSMEIPHASYDHGGTSINLEVRQ